MTEMLQAVSTVGFPIVVAAWFMKVGHKTTQQNIQAINNMANAVDNNTRTIEKLCDQQWVGLERQT